MCEYCERDLLCSEVYINKGSVILTLPLCMPPWRPHLTAAYVSTSNMPFLLSQAVLLFFMQAAYDDLAVGSIDGHITHLCPRPPPPGL